MSALALVPLMLAGLLACTSESDSPNFGGGGNGDSSDDTGGDDTGGATNPDAPAITSINAEFYNPPQQNTVIEVFVFYDDPQDDVDGGKVTVDVVASGGDEYGDTLDIDGVYARLDDSQEGNPVWFWICGGEDCDAAVDTNQTFDLTVQLQDAAGNWGEAVTKSVQ